MTRIKRSFIVCIATVLLVITCAAAFFPMFVTTANAATVTTGGVLADLRNDKSFNESSYAPNADDTVPRILSLAEGESGDLFLYVYQGSNIAKSYEASYINMSLQPITDVKPDYSLYSLTLIDADGVFVKYKVEGFRVQDLPTRTYTIAAIYRPFDPYSDPPAWESDDVKDHCGFKVARTYYASEYNGRVVYTTEYIDVVEIDIKALGFVKYPDGFKLTGTSTSTHGHFVAFSIENYDPDKIVDAKIRYVTQSKTWTMLPIIGEETKLGKEEPDEKLISEMEPPKTSGSGLFGHVYEWERILTTKEFEKQLEDFKHEDIEFTKGGLGDSEWVFQFLETDYALSSVGYGGTMEKSTLVSGVTILQLSFIQNGKPYNLGVVSDIMSDDGKPDFEITPGENLLNAIGDDDGLLERIIALLMLLLIVLPLTILCAPLISLVLSVLAKIFSLLINGFVYLVKLPFLLFSRDSDKNKKEKTNEK